MSKLQTVYIPTKVEDELPEKDEIYLCKVGFNTIKQIELFKGIFIKQEGNENIDDDTDITDIIPDKSVTEWLKPTEAFVFTPEELKPLQDLVDEGYDAYDTSHHLQVQRMLKTIENFLNKKK